MANSVSNKPLKHVSAANSNAQAWDNDLFQRKAFFTSLVNLIDRIGTGVIVIDAPWGEGKTWFAQNAHKELSSTRKTIYLDAFAHDYFEDPFILVSAELQAMFEGAKGAPNKIAAKAATIGRRMLPLAVSVTAAVAGRLLVGDANVSDKVKEALQDADKDVSKALEDTLSERIKSFSDEKKSIQSFKDTLTEFTTSSNQPPVVIFIDELDRCRPTFAIQLLERIKHFFDVPNLVFVLMMNRDQLEKAIKGLYGDAIDATSYLQKFVDLNLRLPKTVGRQDKSIQILRFAEHLWNLLDFNGLRYDFDEFSAWLKIWGIFLDLSLRDIERLFLLLAAVPSYSDFGALKIYLGILKIKYPSIFQSICDRRYEGHEDAVDTLNQCLKIHAEGANYKTMVGVMISLHNLARTNFEHPSSGDIQKAQVLFGATTSPSTVFNGICSGFQHSVPNWL